MDGGSNPAGVMCELAMTPLIFAPTLGLGYIGCHDVRVRHMLPR